MFKSSFFVLRWSRFHRPRLFRSSRIGLGTPPFLIGWIWSPAIAHRLLVQTCWAGSICSVAVPCDQFQSTTRFVLISAFPFYSYGILCS
jgi:hypothetical protein